MILGPKMSLDGEACLVFSQIHGVQGRGVARSWQCTPVGGGDEGRSEGRLAA